MFRQVGLPIGDYDALISVIRLRLSEIGSTCEAISDLSGLTDTHVSKLVCPARSKILGRISFGTLLQVLGIRLVAIVDDRAYAPLKARLKPARFHRWNRPPREGDEAKAAAAAGRGMMIRIVEIGGPAEVVKVPELRAVVIVPVEEEKAPETPAVAREPERPRFDPAARHPLPAIPRLRYGSKNIR
jgi:hypothetical protein